MLSNDSIVLCRGPEESKIHPFFILIEIGGVILLLMFLTCLKLISTTTKSRRDSTLSYPLRNLLLKNNQEV
jgi:hypothetical protein